MNPELTLFMLVTNRDCVLADFAIHSYRKVFKRYPRFLLEVYANCLSPGNKQRCFRRWKRLPYVSLRDNQAERTIERRIGAHFHSPEGIPLRYDDNCEHYDEVWTREHQLAKTPFWATVDADFEALAPDFLLAMMETLRSNPSLAGISTDYSPLNENLFDTYSNAVIRINQRWHTWCCIYRRETGRYLREVSSFYFERFLPNGKRDAFDSYAHFQQHLLERGYCFATLPSAFQHQFIHYGAFSKNKSITRSNVRLYRSLAIASKCGVIPTSVSYRLNAWSAQLSRVLFDRLFAKAVAERRVYGYEG